MLIVIGIMLSGMLIGYLLRGKKMSWFAIAITVLIWVLLFLLGIEVGGDEKIIKGLESIGIEAIAITLAGLLGSVVAAWALWRLVNKKNNSAKDER